MAHEKTSVLTIDFRRELAAKLSEREKQSAARRQKAKSALEKPAPEKSIPESLSPLLEALLTMAVQSDLAAAVERQNEVIEQLSWQVESLQFSGPGMGDGPYYVRVKERDRSGRVVAVSIDGNTYPATDVESKQ